MAHSFTFNAKTKNISCGGVDVIVFSDDYACGHQAGISLIMHDRRMASCGDVRFEQTPGQWQPTPVRVERIFDEEKGMAGAKMHYPDLRGHMKGFNPIIYPDLELDYTVQAFPTENGVKVSVIMEKPIPKSLQGKAGFNLELVPVHVVGKSWIMDEQVGIFPTQPNGPTLKKAANIDLMDIYPQGEGKANLQNLIGDRTYYSPIVADDVIAEPYCIGHVFTALPDSDLYCFTVRSEEIPLRLYDGRMNHNNGWFVLNSELPVETTGEVLTWYIEPRVKEDWIYQPVVQVSQIGYHPDQQKKAIIECDVKDKDDTEAFLYKFTKDGAKLVSAQKPMVWGEFLRYNYKTFDFSAVTEEGLYQVCYKEGKSAVFAITKTVYDRGVWQPVLEYFLPVQMCHMQVREKYRIWHGLCHMDDAVMAPTDYNHFDGYYQGKDTLCKFKSGEHVPGLNQGGWHDAGDYDLRIESQAGEVYILSLVYEAFKTYYDSTTVNQKEHLVEIHLPDGKNDLQEQIEHGLLTVIGGYEALGRFYRGIICRDLRQYVLLGDGANMTDGVPSEDDRWVFTEDNPDREFEVAAQLACASRSMAGFNEELAAKAIHIAVEVYHKTEEKGHEVAKMQAAIELFLSTSEEEYKAYILNNAMVITENFGRLGWLATRVIDSLNDLAFKERMTEKAKEEYADIIKECEKTPYGVPYRPGAWGSGWGIQGFGVRYGFLYRAFPDIFSPEPMHRALHFILGVHPGTNTAAFASGVGAKTNTTAYGANRADYSFIPGGVSSGTELISPNFPEFLEFPFLWQQGEYVLGGGSSNYMFLVLSVLHDLSE